MEWLGKEPPMMPVEPKMSNEPIKWPVVAATEDGNGAKNSLWKKQSKAFFRDQRAASIGDIMTVRISIQDRAELDNRTERIRIETDETGASNFFGLEDKLTKYLPNGADPSSLISTNSNVNNRGEGQIEREEIIDTVVAAVVTEVLPNGNLLIYGSQEVRVNYEVRQLTVQGVIRPEDISPQNEIQYSQIAEARISYGGKGIIMDIQQPRLGNQLADILSPW
jgi:flagellar L-ring protein precursor FlgH